MAKRVSRKGASRARRVSRKTALPNELHGEQRSLEALRAHQLREEPGRETPGRIGHLASGVLVQVCL
ncbi:MAG: hypothetical protein HY561_00875, partial [Gemmatimonadetes bacterium]|nr:hypothetical protein [Gemmatimonadota bacterium]